MGMIKVIPIHTKQEENDFIAFPKVLYADCKQYVPDMDMDMRNMFDPKKNSGLAFTDLQGFVAYRDDKVVGRIVGIINHHANEKWNKKTVRFAYFDFVDDHQVSEALLKAVENWGRNHGMDNVEGPLGITDFDKEGMLVEDFDKLSSMVTYYNYAYYPEHMEALGYEKAVDWVSIRVDVPKEVPAKYARVSKLSGEMFGLQVKCVTKKQFIQENIGHKLFELLNAAYSPLFGFSKMTEEQADEFVDKYLPLLNLDLLPMVVNNKGEIVAAAVTIGSLSHALQKANGKLFPLGWYHLLKSLKWKREDTVELLLIAVRPDLQGLGVNALLFDDLIPKYNKLGFKFAETGPQLEDNVKELSQWKPLGPSIIKRRRCYKKSIQ
jgi:GNAT superfamily N-acetyltransferase